MKNIYLWIIGIGLILIIGLVLLLGLGFLRLQGMPMGRTIGGSNVWRDGYWDHHDFRWGIPVMGLLGGLLMLFIPFGLLALTVIGVVFLVRALQKPQHNDPPLPVGELCENCGKTVAPEWQVCPYCGTPLKGD
jgi:hypothetical protein